MRDLSNLQVAIASGVHAYPTRAPYDPPERYPELPYNDRTPDRENQVYPMVREALRLLGLDAANFETARWNPLGEIIEPGMRVVLKPNFVMHKNHGSGPVEAVVTHASVIRPIADYVLIALQGRGELTVCDAPQMNCDWDTLMARNGMGALAEFLQHACAERGVRFTLTDLRKEQTFYRRGIVWKRKALHDATNRTVTVALGKESFMDEVDNTRLYGADYGRHQTIQAHAAHQHEYKVAQELLKADVVISIPKLKTHSKVGTTLNIKNLVGINTDKNHLAHYRVGPPEQGGDEFSNPKWDDRVDRHLCDLLLSKHWNVGKYPFLAWRGIRRVLRAFRKPGSISLEGGNWHGNDTAWRMALDLTRILLCADAEGHVHSRPLRRYFAFIDGVVGGDGNGPLRPDAYRSGVVLAGFNPVAVDWMATTLMGMDPARIRMYVHGAEQMREWVDFSPERVEPKSDRADWIGMLRAGESVFRFRTPLGWRGRVEQYSLEAARAGR